MLFNKDLSKIIARNAMHSYSDSDMKLLKQWRKESEKNSSFYLLIKSIFKIDTRYEKTEAERIPVNEFFTRTSLYSIVNRKTSFIKIAASIAVIISISSLFIQFFLYSGANRVELIADAGLRSEAFLPDGSKVWLNSGSRLIYEQKFGRVRDVVLFGEAFFDVADLSLSSFYVKADDLKIKVTGTKFNIRNYYDESLIETTLSEGSVLLLTEEGTKVKMSSGDVITMDRVTKHLTKRKKDIRVSTSWKEGFLFFSGTPFTEMISRLEKWYNIKVIYEPSEFDGIHYSGTIKDLRLDQVFNFISLTIPINVRIEEKNVIIEKQPLKTKLSQ